MAEVAQQPPEPGAAALARLVVCDHARAFVYSRPARRGLERAGIRQRMAASPGAAVAQFAGEVAAEVEKGSARQVAGEPAALTRRGVGEREAAVDHDKVRLAQMRAQPVHGHQWAERFAHEPRA